MNTTETGSPNHPAGVNAPAENGDNRPARVSTADLEAALMGTPPSAVNDEEVPTSPATGDPAAPAETPPPAEPGQNDLEAEPPAEGETPEGATPEAGGEQTVLSQTGDAELDAALGKLTPAMRKHVVAVSELLGDGTLSNGEIPRIGTLLHERHEMAQTIEGLKQELAEATAARENARPTVDGAGQMPEAVAKLKSVGEVKARQVQARQAIRSLEDFLETNPDGGESGGKTYTREQLKAAKRGWEDELAVLPERAEQLQQQAGFNQVRQQATQALLKEFPVLTDPQNPVTKAYQQLAKLPQFQRETNGDELAYYLARGHAVVEAERAAKARMPGSANGAAASGVRKPVGKVPVGKPHANGSANPPTPSEAMKRFKAVAAVKPGERVTSQKLEDVLAHLPVGR